MQLLIVLPVICIHVIIIANKILEMLKIRLIWLCLIFKLNTILNPWRPQIPGTHKCSNGENRITWGWEMVYTVLCDWLRTGHWTGGWGIQNKTVAWFCAFCKCKRSLFLEKENSKIIAKKISATETTLLIQNGSWWNSQVSVHCCPREMAFCRSVPFWICQ